MYILSHLVYIEAIADKTNTKEEKKKSESPQFGIPFFNTFGGSE